MRRSLEKENSTFNVHNNAMRRQHPCCGLEQLFERCAVGPVKPEDMTDAVWDHIFLDAPRPSDCRVPEALLEKMCAEFNFWYPFDLRVWHSSCHFKKIKIFGHVLPVAWRWRTPLSRQVHRAAR